MSDILFDIKGLTLYYNGHKALDVPSLRLEKGRIYSIVGPNGAGKTTFLNILAFLLTPSSGTIIYDGTEVKKGTLRNLRHEVTLVHQNPYLFHNTVEKNLSYGLKIRGMGGDDIKKRVNEGLSIVGMSGMGTRISAGLSGGEMQRVALARALVLKPKVLLLDEPFTHIDINHTTSIEAAVKEFNRSCGTTVIFTTHDIIQAVNLSGDVLALRDGRILEKGYIPDSHGIDG